jgi:hypothetical protein
MSDRDLKFVYLFCQTDMFLFVIETPMQMYVNVNILLVGTSTNKFQSPVLSNIYVLPDIRSDIYFKIVGPTAFLSVRTDGFREVCSILISLSTGV